MDAPADRRILPDGRDGPVDVTEAPTTRRTLAFVPDPAEVGRGDVTVVLDTTWTPAGPVAEAAGTIGVRDVAREILERDDLIAMTGAALDRWAAQSGIVDVLTVDETSFWFYVRLRHWSWLEERILWAGIADRLVRAHRPERIWCSRLADGALRDVLRLVAARDGIRLVEEPDVAAVAEAAAGPTASSAVASSSPPAVAVAPVAGANQPPIPAPRRRLRSRLLGRPIRRVVRAIRTRLVGPPPVPPKVARQLELKARVDRIRANLDALAAEPEARLLVVQEHARQRVDTRTGARLMNPYLDPVVDQLRGSVLEPIILDIRARIGQDAAWERIGQGLEPRVLPSDALAPVPAPTPAAAPVPAAAVRAPNGRTSQAPPAPPIVSPAEARLRAWRRTAPAADPIEIAGVDLAPLLADEVVATAVALPARA